ncbi:adenine phosphoribosyltransferase [Aliidiomarina maris]|uniref:Adenine phosphoribosyltransferase n=1 Tax=Aliidiomarina maris TaxID=531312 RepID=A0A327X529_9GAMM|nr:adenine phosphoribosyltransferase [Aliidiomarina maris]MBA3988980.1 adenine phosphoribosyltransferase [Idiomarina sp.]MCL5051214.1 adenine phosphoribosyltransferase [Bacillota bacterium]RAK01841.1 adenine phosphoribosyltransferase [Aliidiomarina maris]RUO28650.1 adenine phosphoribosyltransferase [Aliidiomarina maris]
MSVEQQLAYIRSTVTSIQDYPKPGIVFRDITSTLADAKALRLILDVMTERYQDQGLTQIAGIEARGFIFAAALADRLGCGMTLVRKKGKLPRAVHSQSYSLEYGNDTLELHQDALNRNDRVLLIDDLLATGGTMRAAADLVAHSGATVVEAAFLIELKSLPGRERIEQSGVPCYAICAYD